MASYIYVFECGNCIRLMRFKKQIMKLKRTELRRARHNPAHSAECGQLKLLQHPRATEDAMGHLASTPGIMESLLIFFLVYSSSEIAFKMNKRKCNNHRKLFSFPFISISLYAIAILMLFLLLYSSSLLLYIKYFLNLCTICLHSVNSLALQLPPTPLGSSSNKNTMNKHLPCGKF